MTSVFSTRNLMGAMAAVLITVAIHGGWLAGMDRDAAPVAVISA